MHALDNAVSLYVCPSRYLADRPSNFRLRPKSWLLHLRAIKSFCSQLQDSPSFSWMPCHWGSAASLLAQVPRAPSSPCVELDSLAELLRPPTDHQPVSLSLTPRPLKSPSRPRSVMVQLNSFYRIRMDPDSP